MKVWHIYDKPENIRGLRSKGRELLGKHIIFQEKRDGENISLTLKENGEIQISSHHQYIADSNIQYRMKNVPEYSKAVALLNRCKEYNENVILYGELLKQVSPTRLEPKRVHCHWILFDIYDLDTEKYYGYTRTYQYAYQFKIPIVNIVCETRISSMDELINKSEDLIKYCKKHRREGVVGKIYDENIFFKIKCDIPTRIKLDKQKNSVVLPDMPKEKIESALRQAYWTHRDDWNNKSIIMPVIAKYIIAEANEHCYRPPSNLYNLYLDADTSGW